MSKSKCPICIEIFNKLTRKPVKCPYCNFSACKSCIERVILESKSDSEVACMQCNKVWCKDFLVEQFTAKFTQRILKKHRGDQLFDREMALLPSTQLVIDYKARHDKLNKEVQSLKKNLAKLIKDHAEKERELHKFKIKSNRNNDPNYQKKEHLLTFRVRVLNRKIMETKRNIRVKNNRKNDLIKSQTNTTIEHAHMAFNQLPATQNASNLSHQIRRCASSTCHGFLINGSWKCTLCNSETCSKCHELVADPNTHVCDPSTIMTINMLQDPEEETKSCPNCATLIHKVFGCDHMFCVNCHTPFHWETLKIITTHIQNPHINSQMQHNNCCTGVIPSIYQIADTCKRLEIDRVPIIDFVRNMIYVHDTETVKYAPQSENEFDETANLDIRIKYMKNQISLDQFKKILHTRENSKLKKREIYSILSVMYSVSCDIIRYIIQSQTIDEVKLYQNKLKELLDNANNGLFAVKKKYGGIVPMFRSSGTITYHKKV